MDTGLVLTDEERGFLHGEAGEATRLAMRILARVAPFYGATSLIPVTRAHVDGIVLEGDAGLAFAERLADLGGKVRVPTSLNVGSLDRRDWRRHGLEPCFADRAYRLGQAYVRMGATPSFTCAPYQTLDPPTFGEQIAWSESNAVAFANSVLGARSNRYGDYLDICCAITGRAPAAGLHLDEPRRPTLQIALDPLPAGLAERADFWGVLGYLVGAIAADRVPVVTGLEDVPTPDDDSLKAMTAAAATSGSVALMHVVGHTPEAPSLAAVLGGHHSVEVQPVTLIALRAARAELTTAGSDDPLDLVAFGSPHCSLRECRTLAAMMSGRRAAPRVEVFVTTSRAVRELLKRDGTLATLEAFGATVTADTCIVVAPLVRPDVRTLMTDSAKYAHYGPGILRVGAIFGSTEACVESAVAGHVVLEDGAWGAA